MKLPTDVAEEPDAHHQPADARRRELVIALRPTGLSDSSPQCEAGRSTISHIGLTCTPFCRELRRRPRAPRSRRRRRSGRARTSPGSTARAVPSRIHSHANTGANVMMNSGLQRLEPAARKAPSRTSTLRVLRSANRFSVEPACSNTDQNSAAREEQHADHVQPLALGRRPVAGERTASRRSTTVMPSSDVAGGVGDLRGGDRQRRRCTCRRRARRPAARAPPPRRARCAAAAPRPPVMPAGAGAGRRRRDTWRRARTARGRAPCRRRPRRSRRAS